MGTSNGVQELLSSLPNAMSADENVVVRIISKCDVDHKCEVAHGYGTARFYVVSLGRRPWYTEFLIPAASFCVVLGWRSLGSILKLFKNFDRPRVTIIRSVAILR